MFTGIIEEKGTVIDFTTKNDAMEMKIHAPEIVPTTRLGDSISVNGVCLTVKELVPPYFFVDLMPETVTATALKTVEKDSRVNLERALAADGRFGGHIVTGHVDGTGEILEKKEVDNAVYFRIKLDESVASQLVYKGSIAIDGISLTVFGAEKDHCLLSIIPHTLEHTTLGDKSVHDPVNIELDMVGKYIQKHVESYLSQSANGEIKLNELFPQVGMADGDDNRV